MSSYYRHDKYGGKSSGHKSKSSYRDGGKYRERYKDDDHDYRGKVDYRERNYPRAYKEFKNDDYSRSSRSKRSRGTPEQYYSVSSDSESERSYGRSKESRKVRNVLSDTKVDEPPTNLILSKELRAVEEDSGSESNEIYDDEFTSAKQLSQKTQLILSKFNHPPQSDTNFTNNETEKQTSMFSNQNFKEQPNNHSTSPAKEEPQSKQGQVNLLADPTIESILKSIGFNKESMETAAAVLDVTNNFPKTTGQSQFSTGHPSVLSTSEESKISRKARCQTNESKSLYETFSDSDNDRPATKSQVSKVKKIDAVMTKNDDDDDDDDDILRTIKSFRNAVEKVASNECEEIRNVKLQPQKTNADVDQGRKSIKRPFTEVPVERNPPPKRSSERGEGRTNKLELYEDALKMASKSRWEEELEKEEKKSRWSQSDVPEEMERRKITVKSNSTNKRKSSISSNSSSGGSGCVGKRNLRLKSLRKGSGFRKRHRSSSDEMLEYRNKPSKHIKKSIHQPGESFKRDKYPEKYSTQSNKKSYAMDAPVTSTALDLKGPSPVKKQVGKESLSTEKLRRRWGTDFDYFDEGSHWCEKCNVIYDESLDYLKHLHTDTHQKSVRHENKPWADKMEGKSAPPPQRNRISVPLKGLEFMMATSAYYCKLCVELLADVKIAEKHIKSEEHNRKFRSYAEENPSYQIKESLEKEAKILKAVRVTSTEANPTTITTTTTTTIAASNKAGKEDRKVEERQEEETKDVEDEEEEEKGVDGVVADQTSVESPGKPLPDRPVTFTIGNGNNINTVNIVTKSSTATDFMSRDEKIDIKVSFAPSSSKVTTAEVASTTSKVKDTMGSGGSSSTSHLSKKLPFIGKRPQSKLAPIKNESDPSKSQAPTTTTNSASLSREELLSRVMKDTIIIPPKDVKITPLGVHPDISKVNPGFMGPYMPMMSPYMAYPHFMPAGTPYYDMSMYYDPSLYGSTCYDSSAFTIAEGTADGQQCIVMENNEIADIEMEETGAETGRLDSSYDYIAPDDHDAIGCSSSYDMDPSDARPLMSENEDAIGPSSSVATNHEASLVESFDDKTCSTVDGSCALEQQEQWQLAANTFSSESESCVGSTTVANRQTRDVEDNLNNGCSGREAGESASPNREQPFMETTNYDIEQSGSPSIASFCLYSFASATETDIVSDGCNDESVDAAAEPSASIATGGDGGSDDNESSVEVSNENSIDFITREAIERMKEIGQ